MAGAPHVEPHIWAGFFWLSSVLACLLGAIVLWQISKKKRAHLPPAPPGWMPLLGHMPLLGARPHHALAELARRHGPKLMSLRLGSALAIVASTPDAAQLLLQTHDQAFAGRPMSSAAIHIGFNCSDIVFSPANAHWRRMRQICTTDLFSNKRIHSFQPIRVKAVQDILAAAYAQRGQVVQLRPKMLAASLDVVAKMTLGRPVSEVSPQATGLITQIMQLAGVFNVGDFIPWLARFDLQGYEKRLKLLGQDWSSLLQELLDLRRAAMADRKVEDGSEAPLIMDLLDVLLTVSDLTDDSIKAVLANMFVGGTETSSITVEWALAELMANPAAMGQLQAELDEVVGRRRVVQEEDVQRLPYLQAVVKEAMRLHPVAPLLAPHESVQACEVYGYRIPAKTRVLVNVWAIGRDPGAWDNPLQFQPERFMPEGEQHHVNTGGQHFQLLPFGSGRRKCPAFALGLVSVQATLASLVQAFDWTLPPTTHEVDLSEKFGLTVTMASPLALVPTPRLLDASLYHNF